MYICQGCKNAKHAGNAVVVESIGVSLDWSHFLTDPEALNHKCIELDYTYEYLAAEVGQGDLLEQHAATNDKSGGGLSFQAAEVFWTVSLECY